GGGGEQCQFYSDDEHGHGLDFGDHFGDLRRDKEHYPDGYAGVDALSSEPEPDECGGREHVAGDGDVERDSTGGRSSGDADQQQHRGSDGSGQRIGGGGGEQCQFYSDDEHGHGLDFGDHFGDLRRDKEHYSDGYAGGDALSSEPEPDERGGREHVAGDGDVERDSTGGRSSGDTDQQQHRGSDGSGQRGSGGWGKQCQFYSADEHGHGLDFGDHFGDLRRDKEHYPDGYAGV